MTPRQRSLATSAAASLALTVIVFFVALGALREAAPEPAPVAVRYPEGALHGFLVLRSAGGTELAPGDLVVDVRDGAVESRIVFRFPDGSVHDERVTFTQDSVFRLLRYRLEQRGAAFPTDVEIELDGATGRSRVVARQAEGEAEVHEDTLRLPPDTY
ncbi:MAG TPA: hypothetical protein VFH97_00010, partial [Gemmatimonadales bacterium]|nr:hypothetical protein [Gemmatimonadales bacterium]